MRTAIFYDYIGAMGSRKLVLTLTRGWKQNVITTDGDKEIHQKDETRRCEDYKPWLDSEPHFPSALGQAPEPGERHPKVEIAWISPSSTLCTRFITQTSIEPRYVDKKE